MEKEEEILDAYIKGTRSSEDNGLRAAIGSLSAKRSKELAETMVTLRNTISSSASNLMINNTHNSDKLKKEVSDQVSNLNQGIARQVENLINSNEKLSLSNENNAAKTHRFTVVNIWLTGLIFATGAVGLWNIYLTNEIKNESIRANQIEAQPFLNFIDVNQKPYEFINSGKGAALNFFLVIWDKPAQQLYVTPEGVVGEALGVDKMGYISDEALIKTDFDQVKKEIPITSELFNVAADKDTTWFAIVYEDIYGKKYATLVRGPGSTYTEAVRFVELEKN